MNWILVSQCFLTGCVVGVAWVCLGIVRSVVNIRVQHEEDMRMIRRMIDGIMEAQVKIVENNQKSFQTIGDNMMKLTQLAAAAFTVEPRLTEPQGKPLK